MNTDTLTMVVTLPVYYLLVTFTIGSLPGHNLQWSSWAAEVTDSLEEVAHVPDDGWSMAVHHQDLVDDAEKVSTTTPISDESGFLEPHEADDRWGEIGGDDDDDDDDLGHLNPPPPSSAATVSSKGGGGGGGGDGVWGKTGSSQDIDENHDRVNGERGEIEGTGGGGTGSTVRTGTDLVMQSDECPTGWKSCSLCHCCHEYDPMKISVLCEGENITDIPQDLPVNTTHLTFRETSIVTLTGETIDEGATGPKYSKLRKYIHMVHLSFNINKRLTLIDVGAFEFPDDHGSLQHLSILVSPNMKEIKRGALGKFHQLKTLRIASTGLQTVPDWFVFHAGDDIILDELDLSNNKFPLLPFQAFTHLNNKVANLLLDDNPIQKIEDYAFANATIQEISLHRNVKLTTLGENAFADVKNLNVLDLSNTRITSLPTRGLRELRRLLVEDVESMKVFPMVLDLSRHMEVAKLTYPYHCCAFTHVEKQNTQLYESFQINGSSSLQVSQECSTTIGNFLTTTPYPGMIHQDIGQFDGRYRRDTSIPRWLKRSIETYKMTNTDWNVRDSWRRVRHERQASDKQPDAGKWGGVGKDNLPEAPMRINGVEDPTWHGSTLDPTGTYSNVIECGQVVLERLRNVTCTPLPDAFNPCEDVMGFLWLRVIVWFVVSTALFGNFVVLIVTLGSRFKLTVPKFLMCNLAFADLSLGVYLLMLAVIDLHTMGVYFAHAIPWQSEGGCQVAGFLAIFATNLSVFTLTVITLERWYAISHAIHLTKRLRLRQASTVMVCGWLYAAIMALLPLLGISSYGKTSICLPMETSTPLDQAFVLLLLVCNAIGFMIIFGCYVDMYRQVRGNNTAARRNDANIAKRMSVLVFTDFICLFPIAFFGLTAAAGSPFITVTDSKILLVFFFPFNSCANPFLYAIFTKQFHKDLFCTLDRLGICKKKAAKYRFTYTSNPMSLSHSRNYAHHVVRHSSAGSVLTTYMSDVHRSSKASITINTSPKVTPQHTPKESKKISPKISKKKDPKKNSPPVTISLNGYPAQRSSIDLPDRMLKDSRKLSIVREVSQTSDDVSDVTNYVLDDVQAHKAKDKQRQPVRSVSEYTDDDSRCNDSRSEYRKQSQVTCCSSGTEISQVDSLASDSSTMPTQDTIEEEESDLTTTSEDEEHDCSAATLQQTRDSGICRDHKYELQDMTGVKGHSPETRRLLKTPSPSSCPSETNSSPSHLAHADFEPGEKLDVFDTNKRDSSSSPVAGHRSPLMKQKRLDSDSADPNPNKTLPPSTPNEGGRASPNGNDGYINTSYSPLDSPEYSYKDFR